MWNRSQAESLDQIRDSLALGDLSDEENAENAVLFSGGRMKQRDINSKRGYDQFLFIDPSLEKGPLLKAAEDKNVVGQVDLSLKLPTMGGREAVELERRRVFGLAASLLEQYPLGEGVMGDRVLEVRWHSKVPRPL
jgi:hypothetical protein